MKTITFTSVLEYQRDPGHDRPLVLVRLTYESSFTVEAFIDTGCERMVFDGEVLEPIGWSRLPEDDPGIVSLTGAAGCRVVASPLHVGITLPGLDFAFEATVYGSHTRLPRNLLGLDLLRHMVLAFDHDANTVYATSLRDNERRTFIRDSSTSATRDSRRRR